MNSDKKDARNSRSKNKNRIISQPRISLNSEKYDKLAEFSSHILKEAKSIDKKHKILKMNSPRFLKREQLGELSSASFSGNGNQSHMESIEKNENKPFQKKKKSINNLFGKDK